MQDFCSLEPAIRRQIKHLRAARIAEVAAGHLRFAQAAQVLENMTQSTSGASKSVALN
jgi:hypothetical protein